MAQLMVDADGVFASFDEHLLNTFGKPARDFGGDQHMWAAIDSVPNYWDDMPVMKGAREFWDKIKHLNPIVLTGCPKTSYEVAATAKHAWWQRHFNHYDVITCLSRNKSDHMKAPGDILIDDMSKNIKRWEAAGGVGIFHRHYQYDATLATLNRLLGV
jgi:5'(3')-deoxyribonucleotidase